MRIFFSGPDELTNGCLRAGEAETEAWKSLMRHNMSREHRKNVVYPKNEEWGKKVSERKQEELQQTRKTKKGQDD